MIKEKIVIADNKNVINLNLDISNNESLNNDDIKIIKDNNKYIKINQIQVENFNKLVNIIINDYYNYPNYSHFYNIENIFYFLFRDRFETTENIIENEILESYNDEEIQINIEYINNINAKIKLFGESFVRNNINKCYLKINDKIFDLKKEHNFKTKEIIVVIKLIIKKKIFNIDLSKMFSNCYNLKSLDCISKLRKVKIINLNKMFYNCISLKSLPDISEWDISKVKSASLMFYNCISLKSFPNLKKWKLNDNLFFNNSLLYFTSFLDSLKKNDINHHNIIGEGSFGIVVKENLNEKDEKGNNIILDVAAKYIKSKSLLIKGKKKLLINLFKESGMMVNLDHKNIVKLISIHPANTKIIMEYMKGGNLANAIYNKKNLSLYFKIYCLFEICEGLKFLHDKNIIHGDLKSLNILLDKKYDGGDDYPILKLSDFGLSGIKEDICPGETPGFSAPELYETNKKNRTIKADIYSLGVVIYEIFKGESPKKYIKKDNEIKRKFYPLPDIKEENWPKEIKEIILDCCRQKYEERPDVNSIKERLARFCENSKDEKLIKIKNKIFTDNYCHMSKVNQDTCKSYKTIQDSNSKYREFVYKINGIPLNGYGIHIFEDGTIYKGLFENGKINKYGKFIYNNKLIYEGQHNEGKWNGVGKLINKSNMTEYNGYFEDFKFNGFGIIYINIDKNIKKNVEHPRLEGEYENGFQKGIGIYIDSQNRQYKGEWKNGHFWGIGEYKYSNGEICQGEFVNGYRDGFCYIKYTDNSYFEGHCKEGKFNGYGKFIIKLGEIYEGEWKNGCPLELDKFLII